MRCELITEPAEWPLDLAGAKGQCRIDPEITEHDAELEAYIRSATRTAEAYLNRALIAQQWRLSLDNFPGLHGAIILPLGRVISVDSIQYDDVNGNTVTMPTDEYQAETGRDSRNRILPAPDCTWPCTESERINAARVTYTVGYGDTREDIPEDIIVGIKLILAHYFANREAVLVGVSAAELPLGAEAALGYKRLTPV